MPTRWWALCNATRSWCRAPAPTRGKLAFPWSYGVVLTNITRKQFQDAELHHALEPHRVLCKDEMLESMEPRRPAKPPVGHVPLRHARPARPTTDRPRALEPVPQVRVPPQDSLVPDSDEAATVPDILRVMDIQQEQLARSLGDGHRVIHGVAGSRQDHDPGLPRRIPGPRGRPRQKPHPHPVLQRTSGREAASAMEAKGLSDRVHVRHFTNGAASSWSPTGKRCHRKAPSVFDDMVDYVIRAVDRHQIPSGQYQAVLIDEGTTLRPSGSSWWYRWWTRHQQPAGAVRRRAKHLRTRPQNQFSFKSVGIQAQGAPPS